MDGLIPLMRRLEAAIDVWRVSDVGTAECALAREEVVDIRRRIAALPIDGDALRTANRTTDGIVLPSSPPVATRWRGVRRVGTFSRR